MIHDRRQETAKPLIGEDGFASVALSDFAARLHKALKPGSGASEIEWTQSGIDCLAQAFRPSPPGAAPFCHFSPPPAAASLQLGPGRASVSSIEP